MGFTARHKMHPVVVSAEGYRMLTYQAEYGQHVGLWLFKASF
jgi:hypothetical protein